MRVKSTMMAVAMAAAAATSYPTASTPAPAGALVLAGNGVAVGATVAKFGVATTAQAIAVVAAALGRPIERGSHGDCGQGAVIGYAKFRGMFELSFVKGRLSGWTADAPTPKTAKGIGVGATVAMLRKAYPDIWTDPGDEANGGLGPRFQREGGPNGWLDGTRPGAKVTGLFAGATCLAGI